MVTQNMFSNSITVSLRQESVSFKKEFIRLGWIYSPSLIKEKYKQYNWPIYGKNKNK
jgi:hypothetical protein